MLKTCMQCQQTKPLPSFAESKLQPDGYCGWCKSCQKQYGLANFDNAGAPIKKSCTHCKFLFEASLKYFGLDMSKKDHLSTKCKKCVKKIRQKKARKNKTYIQKHKRAYDEVGMMPAEIEQRRKNVH